MWCAELYSSPAAECVLFSLIAAWAKPGVFWCGWSHISFPESPPLIQTGDVRFLAVKQVFNKLHLIKCRARLPLFWVSWHLQPSSHCQGLACSETHSTSLTSGTEYAHSCDQVLGNMHFSKAHLSTLLSFPMENGNMHPGLWVGKPGSIFPRLQDNRDGNTFELLFGGPQDLSWIGPALLRWHSVITCSPLN